MIKIVKEPDGVRTKSLADLEDCFRCGSPTPYWSKRQDVPCCLDCALKLEEADVPTKEQWMAS